MLRMIRKLPLLVSLCLFLSCGAIKKKTTYNKDRKVSVTSSEVKHTSTEKELNALKIPNNGEGNLEEIPAPIRSPDKADNIINTALSYTGVRYKFGGTTNKGMDCSGLLYVAFGEHDVPLPRISYQMADEGRRIRIEKVTKGDLLFFNTGRGKNRINHVGLVVAVEGDDIKFIHSSSARGVIVSSMREGFWNHAFVKATRIL